MAWMLIKMTLQSTSTRPTLIMLTLSLMSQSLHKGKEQCPGRATTTWSSHNRASQNRNPGSVTCPWQITGRRFLRHQQKKSSLANSQTRLTIPETAALHCKMPTMYPTAKVPKQVSLQPHMRQTIRQAIVRNRRSCPGRHLTPITLSDVIRISKWR